MKNFLKDEKGQVGGIFTFILALGIFSLIYIALSVLMDYIISANNEFLGTFHHTQEFVDAMNVCFSFWFALPVIILLGLITFLIKNAIRSRTGMVE